jgi:predicted short-subunit dehydrogenase-like oxidoreductase (DUF2520 family)
MKGMMLRLGFIGSGTVAMALACGLNRLGYHVTAVSSLRHESAKNLATLLAGCLQYTDNQSVADNADLIFIATPDDVIPVIDNQIHWRSGQYVVHCSGADSSDVLRSARESGACVGVLHPLQTFAVKNKCVDMLSGITFAVEAEKPLLNELIKMAEVLGGRHIVIQPQDKILYHAAAVFVSNYLVTLTQMAGNLWKHFGVSTPEAVQALLPLIKGTMANIENIGLPDCLTGPIARGDVGTIKKHLTALNQYFPDIEPLYRELGLKTIPIALAKGRIDAAKACDLEDVLNKT